MQRVPTRLFTAAVMGAALFSGNAWSHANIVPPGVDGNREYPEGNRQFLRFNLAHDCGHGDVHDPTLATVVILPNGTDAVATIDGVPVDPVDYLFTSNPYAPGAPPYSAPAVFGIKPSVDADWSDIVIARNETLPYYNHGVNTEDVGYIQWHGGYVPNEMMENLEFVATFPKFTAVLGDGSPNCATRMRVYLPSAQYCTDGAINGWFLGDPVGPLADAMAADTHGLVSNAGTYAPYVDVVRTSPVDASCTSEEMLVVYPSEAAVIAGQLQWDAKRAHKMLNEAAIQRVPLR